MQLAVLIYLADQIVTNGVGGSGEIQAGNYGGAKPTWVPASGAGIAFDTSTGVQWNYYGGDWN
jgi:hypothetical protein